MALLKHSKSSVYLLDYDNTQVQNLHFVVNCRKPSPEKWLNLYPGTRIVEKNQSSSSEWSGTSCKVSSLPTSIAIWFMPHHAIGHRNRNTAILFPFLGRLDVPFRLAKNLCYCQNFKSAVYLHSDANSRIQALHFVGNCRKLVPRKMVEFITRY
jgi:hypothetical protein